MAKSNKVVAPPASAPAPAEAKPAPAPVLIKAVKTGLKYRGAREAWYKELTAHEGKPLADFVKATTDKPPSLPKSGRPEAPGGWVSYFTRTGVLTLG